MFSIISSLLKERRRNAPSLQETRNEAASQYEAKRAKLDTAVDAVFTDSLRKIDQDERERVAVYMAAKVPALQGIGAGNDRKGNGMAGDFIVCDDYRKGMGALSVGIMGLVMTAGIGAACFALWVSTQRQDAITPVDTDTRYESRIEVEVE